MPNVPSSDKTTDHENKTKANKNRQKKKTKASSTDLQPQQQKTSSADRKTQEEKKKKGKRRLERRYGRFHCKNCNRGWESSHVYVVAGTLKVGSQLVHILCRLAVIGGDRTVEIPAL